MKIGPGAWYGPQVMVRIFLVPGLLGGVLFVFWLWALFDVIMTDSLLIRNMQKGTWIFLVLVIPTIGAVAWLLLGRPDGASLVPGGQVKYEYNPHRSERRPLGVEDSSDWSSPNAAPSIPSSVADSESLAIRERKLMEYEAELAKREEALEAREKEDEADPDD